MVAAAFVVLVVVVAVVVVVVRDFCNSLFLCDSLCTEATVLPGTDLSGLFLAVFVFKLAPLSPLLFAFLLLLEKHAAHYIGCS